MLLVKSSIIGLFLLIAYLIIGCSGSNNSVNPKTDPETEVKRDPITAITFVMQSSGLNYSLYVDGDKKGNLSSLGQEIKVEVSPEYHTYYVIDEGCTKLTSKKDSLFILGGQLLKFKISNSNPGFDIKTISELKASDGDYSGTVKLSWNDLNKNRAPKYEVSRKTSSGSYSHLATVTSNSYTDNSVAKGTLYSYRVRAVWACMNGRWSLSNSGYSKSIKFYNTRIELDDPNHSIYIRTDTKVYGYDEALLMFGGYWYKKRFGFYFVANANCNTNDPNNYLGHIWGYWLHNDISTVNSWFKVDWDCFKEKTGTYYGKIKIYSHYPADSKTFLPNDPTLAQSVWVSFQWVSGVSSEDGSTPKYIVALLDESEVKLLEADMLSSGFEQDPQGSFNTDILLNSSESSGGTTIKEIDVTFNEK